MRSYNNFSTKTKLKGGANFFKFAPPFIIFYLKIIRFPEIDGY